MNLRVPHRLASRLFVRVTKQIPAIGRYGGALVLLKLNYWLNLAIRHNGLFYKKKKQRKKKMNDLNPLSQDFTIKSLLKFAFPTILMMIFMGLYTVVDTIFVARFVDTNALSALNIVCPIINLIVGLGTMLATGGSAIVARKMGAGEQQKAAQDFTLIISAGVFLGVLIAVVGTAFIDRIVWGLGASGILFPYCKEYLFVLLLFTPASILQVLFQNLIVTAGRPGMGMVLGVSAGIANILLDYIFMVPLQMGIKGAAFGTGIGYMIPAVIGLLFFPQRKTICILGSPS